MAVPVVVTASLTTSHNGASTSWSGTYPTGLTDKDVLVAHIFDRFGGGVISAVPTGWTLVDQQEGHQNNGEWVYWKAATGSESGTVTWTGSSKLNSVLIFRMTGADRIDPFPVGEVSKAGSSGNTTTATAPSVTTAGTDRLLLAFVSDSDIGGMSSTAFTTEDYDSSSGSGSSARELGLYEQARPTAGATGTRDVTVPAAAWAIIMAAIRPADPSPSPPTGLAASVINT